MNPCESLRESLIDAILTGGAPSLSAAQREHLAACPACRAFQSQLAVCDAGLNAWGQRLRAETAPARRRAAEACRALATLARPVATGRRWLRWALAAGLLLVAGLVAAQWRVSLVPATFARVERAVDQVPWLHLVLRGDGPHTRELREVWVGFDAGILAARLTDGQVSFVDIERGREFLHRRGERTITVGPLRLDELVYDLRSPSAFLRSVLRSFRAEGARLVERLDTRSGEPVRRVTVTSHYPHGACTLQLELDSETDRLRSATETWHGPAGAAQRTEVSVTYPPSGPASIYDLGVPVVAELRGVRPFTLTPSTLHHP